MFRELSHLFLVASLCFVISRLCLGVDVCLVVRNQFETKVSGGTLSEDHREMWERCLFGGAYDDAKAFDRPKYGVMNFTGDPMGIQRACRQYGDSYMLLKAEVDFRPLLISSFSDCNFLVF